MTPTASSHPGQSPPAPWLLTGGSGLIGQALATELARRAIPCLQATRAAPRPGTGGLQWNPYTQSPFAHAAGIEGLHAAVHLSGANLAGRRWTAAYKQEILRSRTESTAALARALAALRKPPRVLIAASATGIYGNRCDELLTEASAPGQGFLAQTCQAWEAATAPAEAAGIRVVHLRLGVVLTPHGGALAKVLPLFRAGLGGRLGSGLQWLSWIALPDVVSAILYLTGIDAQIDSSTAPYDDSQNSPAPAHRSSTALDGPVNCIAPEPVTNAEYTRTLAAILHRPAWAAAPAFALRAALGEMADEALLASCRALPDRLLASGFRFQHPHLRPALEHLLGREPTEPSSEPRRGPSGKPGTVG